MRIAEFMSLVAAANTRAIVNMRPVTIPTAALVVTWRWSCPSLTGDPMDTPEYSTTIPMSALGEDRHPHYRAVLGYLRMAADEMAKSGGYPNKRSRLYPGLTTLEKKDD